MRALFIALSVFLSAQYMNAAEKAFPQTEVGTLEIKMLPASTLIVSKTNKDYFSSNNGLFRPLFRYISQNNIAMTTPVEAEMQPGRMYFYIGGDAAGRELKASQDVEVIELPERTVASIGVRGGYSKENFYTAAEELGNWLSLHDKFTADGPARGVFWNGPYVPGFMKRFEVHIPVRLKPEPMAD